MLNVLGADRYFRDTPPHFARDPGDAAKCLTLGGKRGLVGVSATACVARVAMERAGEPVLDDLVGPVIARDVLGVRVGGGCAACAWSRRRLGARKRNVGVRVLGCV